METAIILAPQSRESNHPCFSYQETTVSGIHSHIPRSLTTLATRLAAVCVYPAQVFFALESDTFAHRDEDRHGMN